MFDVVRENDLRTYIPCRSEICFENCSLKTGETNKQSVLPKDVTHCLIPFKGVATKYMEYGDPGVCRQLWSYLPQVGISGIMNTWEGRNLSCSV